MGWQVCNLPLGKSYLRVALSPDGKRVVTGTYDDVEDDSDVQLWDVETAAQVSSWVDVCRGWGGDGECCGGCARML